MELIAFLSFFGLLSLGLLIWVVNLFGLCYYINKEIYIEVKGVLP